MELRKHVITKAKIMIEGKMTPEDAFRIAQHFAVTVRIVAILLSVSVVVAAMAWVFSG